MPEPRGPDHDLYPHRADGAAPGIRLPGDARIAVVVLLYIEDVLPADDAGSTGGLSAGFDARMAGLIVRGGSTVRGQALYDYGNNVGMGRVLRALESVPARVTAPTNAVIAHTRRELLADLVARGYEIAAHGTSASTMISSLMTQEEERHEIRASITTLSEALGHTPRGWVGQNYGQSTRTLAMLEEEGLDYVVDFSNDDSPYLTSGSRGLVSVPNQSPWDDVQMMALRHVSPRAWRDSVVRAFDRLHAEGERSPRVFALHLHPWMAGMPHRIGYVEDALAAVFSRSGVWAATAGELARVYREVS